MDFLVCAVHPHRRAQTRPGCNQYLLSHRRKEYVHDNYWKLLLFATAMYWTTWLSVVVVVVVIGADAASVPATRVELLESTL